MERFGPAIEAAGGIDGIEPERLAEMVAYLIMRDQIEAKRHEQMLMASGVRV